MKTTSISGFDPYSRRLREALRLAEEAHRGQIREGTEDVPYVLHPVSVALTLAAGGEAEDLVIAGLLHDVVEDTDVELGAIEEKFGNRVASTVSQLTKASGKKPSPAEVAAMLQSDDAVRVKSADLTVNLSDILFDAADHGPEHLTLVFSDPRSKLRSYLQLADLLIGRLPGESNLRERLVRVSPDAAELLAKLRQE
jgi:(p)ppGpp synthase/HD superfamily hydrolase